MIPSIAFIEGEYAYAEGTDCPYLAKTEQATEWDRGYLHAAYCDRKARYREWMELAAYVMADD